jgi:hypothetical protein
MQRIICIANSVSVTALFQCTALWSAKPHNTFSGLLLPGDWAYVSVLHSELHAGGRALIKFTQSGGHPILMAKQGSYPTLTDCYLKFTDANLQPTASNTYQLDSNPSDDNNFILAVFNVDYLVQGETQFEILLLGEILFLSKSIWCFYHNHLWKMVLNLPATQQVKQANPLGRSGHSDENLGVF